MLGWVKEYVIKNFTTCKSPCNLQEIYTSFREKHRNVNIGFSKFYALRPKWCVLGGSKMTHSVCICSAHSNVVLLVDAMDMDFKYKDLCLALIISIKIYFRSLLYLYHSQEYLLNWYITGLPYLEILPISIIKLLLLYFLRDRNVLVICGEFKSRDSHTQKYFNCS